MKHQTGGTVWPSGNILKLFLAAMLAVITVITNVCDDAKIFEKVLKNWGAGCTTFPSFTSPFLFFPCLP